MSFGHQAFLIVVGKYIFCRKIVQLSMYYRSTLISLRFFGHLRLIGLLGLFGLFDLLGLLGLMGLLGKKETHET